MPYSKKVLHHFEEPKNYGKVADPDGVGKVGNPICGDMMYLYIKVDENDQGKEIIADIKFQTFGCVAAISVSSMATEMLKGKTVAEAQDLDAGEIIDSLEGLPPVKRHCSVLAIDALNEALYDYFSRQGREIPDEMQAKHERLQKEREMIREKFGDWVKMEEEKLEE